MRIRITLAFVLFVLLSLQAQVDKQAALDQFGFIEEQIIQDKDTITYYLRMPNSKANKLVLVIHGTGAYPVFVYEKKGNSINYKFHLPQDFKLLDSSYAFAIIEKPGFGAVLEYGYYDTPKAFYEKDYLGYRVKQVNEALAHITRKHIKQPEKVIVYGHSEGAPIAANAARQNKQITHLGFWSGNVLNNFYEFGLFERLAATKGQQSDSTAHQSIMGLLGWYQSIIDNPESTEKDQWGFTNKRWASYEHAPIEDLLAVDIPIFTLFGTKDESAPIETSYLIPVQFMQHRKTNLTFRVCQDCSHTYQEVQGEETISHWDSLFQEFVAWTEKN